MGQRWSKGEGAQGGWYRRGTGFMFLRSYLTPYLHRHVLALRVLVVADVGHVAADAGHRVEHDGRELEQAGDPDASLHACDRGRQGQSQIGGLPRRQPACGEERRKSGGALEFEFRAAGPGQRRQAGWWRA